MCVTGDHLLYSLGDDTTTNNNTETIHVSLMRFVHALKHINKSQSYIIKRNEFLQLFFLFLIYKTQK